MRRLYLYKKTRVKIWICSVLIINLLLLSAVNSLPAYAQTGVSIDLEAGSAILIEATTGQVLYEMNADEVLPPASMSKMMTEYLVLDSIKSGSIGWEELVTASENASSVIGSRIFLAEGDKHSVKDMYIAMATASANDTSIALAEFIAGSEESFAGMMNDKAKEIGLSPQAHFINATGLNRADMVEKFRPTGIQGETMMSARDAAKLAMYILNNHEDAVEYSSIPYYKFRERDEEPMINLNRMLEAWTQENNLFSKTAYEGLDGFKTGHTNEAGYCFTGTAMRGGMRLISVVMNTSSEAKRFEETRKLMDYGFNNFEKKTIIAAKSELAELPKVDVKKGVAMEVPLVTQSGIEFIAKKNAKPEEFVIKVEAYEDDKRIAPIEKGAQLGTVTVTYDGLELKANLISTEDVEKGSWARLFFRGIKNFFGDIFSGIKDTFKSDKKDESK